MRRTLPTRYARRVFRGRLGIRLHVWAEHEDRFTVRSHRPYHGQPGVVRGKLRGRHSIWIGPFSGDRGSGAAQSNARSATLTDIRTWSSQTAIITGGGSGLGLALARRL